MSLEASETDPPQNLKQEASAYASLSAPLSLVEAMSLEQLHGVSDTIKECLQFVDTTRNSLAIPFAAFERVRQWRVKRRESRAMEAYDILLPRIKEVEVSLRALLVVCVVI